MKVYTCWSGEYSDRGLEAIFSTKEKAKRYLEIRRNTAGSWEDIDDKPIEHEIDVIEIQEPEYVVFCCINDKGQGWNNQIWGFDRDEKDIDVFKSEDYSDCVFIKVKYNKNKKIMEKAAFDRVSMLYARAMGI